MDVSIRSRLTLHANDVPVGGPVPRRFEWDDLLEAPLPRPDAAPRRYCVPGAQIEAGSERIEHAIILGIDSDGVVQVEHRLGVVQRVLGNAIARERQIVGEWAKDQPRPIARIVRGFTRGLTTLPDRLRSRATKARQLLATQEGRARFRHGLVDPHSLSGEQKALTLFLGIVGVVIALVLAHLAVTLAVPGAARAWRWGVLLYVLGLAHSLGAPILWEPVLIAAASATAPLAAVLVGTAGKVTAAYLAAFLGDEVNERLEKRAARSPRWARVLAASERFARRFGAFAVAVFVATPGLPDAFVIYAFAFLRMPIRKFLAAVAIGSLALNLVIVYGLGRLFGIG